MFVSIIRSTFLAALPRSANLRAAPRVSYPRHSSCGTPNRYRTVSAGASACSSHGALAHDAAGRTATAAATATARRHHTTALQELFARRDGLHCCSGRHAPQGLRLSVIGDRPSWDPPLYAALFFLFRLIVSSSVFCLSGHEHHGSVWMSPSPAPCHPVQPPCWRPRPLCLSHSTRLYRAAAQSARVRPRPRCRRPCPVTGATPTGCCRASGRRPSQHQRQARQRGWRWAHRRKPC